MFHPQSRLCVYPLVVPSCGFRRKDGLPRETRGRNTHDNSSVERSPCPRRRQSPTKSRRGKVTKVLHPVWQQDFHASTSKRERIPRCASCTGSNPKLGVCSKNFCPSCRSFRQTPRPRIGLAKIATKSQAAVSVSSHNWFRNVLSGLVLV